MTMPRSKAVAEGLGEMALDPIPGRVTLLVTD
jgi:hypothetical protein